MDNFAAYLHQIGTALAAGNATEHTYRPALKTLLESLQTGLVATNEPKREKCGAPDFILTHGETPLGYLEAKDIGKPLDEIEGGEQLRRYRESLSNLVLTDYLEFRWYVGGQPRLTARLASLVGRQHLAPEPDGTARVLELLNAFLRADTPTVANPRELAERMAHLARLICDIIGRALEDEDKGGALHQQLEGFKKTLLHDLTEAQFADMYAQTLCYGLFAARCNVPDGSAFTRYLAPHLLPKTNPFLRKMFGHIAGPDLDERIVWAVDDLARLLAKADTPAILADFGRRTRQEDPVVHFYETFLAAYNPKMREARGVYYTPEPVVSYLVRSVDTLLKQEFGLTDGLADASRVRVKSREGGPAQEVHKVQILDPATGTATFLYGIIRKIYESFAGNKGMWSGYVRDHLLPRLFGFELLMAPYAVAHMKLGLLLAETGYRFDSDERLRVYLTNTLEEADEYAGRNLFAQFITDEANAASQVKQDYPVMVVIGNPPYSGHSANTGKWIANLLRGKDTRTGQPTGNYFQVDGQPLGERNPKWLNDDYVKFLRFAQWRIEQTGYGVLAFITNHGYLDNPTFRGMRQSLMQTFDDIYVLDLHGNSKKKERAPDGGKDENVFDIQQGVAIGIFVRRSGGKKQAATVRHAELWGSRESKYRCLLESDVASTQWKELAPSAPFYLFIPQDISLQAEFDEFVRLSDIYPVNNMGITTGDDDRFVAFDEATIFARFGNSSKIARVAYRPFDTRILQYVPGLLARARAEFMQHLAYGQNRVLVCLRRPRNNSVENFFVSNRPTDKCLISSLDNAQLFPLYLYPNGAKAHLFEEDAPTDAPDGRRPNLAPEFVAAFAERVGMAFVPDGKGDREQTFGPEDVFAYMYAVFHSPAYRRRYAEFLKIDFPRLPLPRDAAQFRALCPLGDKLVALHLMETTGANLPSYPEEGSHLVEAVRYTEPTADGTPGRVWINKTQYFEGVAPEVWAFQVGGYQVCAKWLKDRKGRTLTYDDLAHYRRVCAALAETIRLMAAIDAVMETRG